MECTPFLCGPRLAGEAIATLKRRIGFPDSERSLPIAMDPGQSLWQKPQFSLVAKRQNAHLVAGYHEAIEGYITRLAVGNNQFAQFAFDAPAHERVCREIIDGRLNCRYGVQSSCRILVAQKLKCMLDVF